MTRIALVQLASPDEEPQAERIARVEALLRAHAGQGIELFVLPELWSAGYFSFGCYGELAETLEGPTVTMCRRVARELGAAVHLGSFVERGVEPAGRGVEPAAGDAAAPGRLHNTAVLIDRAGRIAQVYRKIHVFGYRSLEAQLLEPGTALSVVDSPVGPLGSTTCYDLRFPGLWQALSERGAEAVIVPAAWPAVRREHWRVLTQARAIEHQLWVIAVNACGVQGTGPEAVRLGGFSRVVDPAGIVVAECGDDEQVLVVDVDPALARAVRTEFPVIGDRLADYTGLSAASGAESGAGTGARPAATAG